MRSRRRLSVGKRRTWTIHPDQMLRDPPRNTAPQICRMPPPLKAREHRLDSPPAPHALSCLRLPFSRAVFCSSRRPTATTPAARRYHGAGRGNNILWTHDRGARSSLGGDG
uniref:Uncharacterized protein n=1 Tax=Triticum urartu TaxID=4572 RepID=A0A8R7PID0_TRIUA